MSSPALAHVRANVVAYVALFFALSGMAYALGVNSVRSKHIKNGEVRTVDVANDTGPNALTTNDVANETLTGNDIANETLNDSDIDGIGGQDIVDESLDADDINEFDLFNDNTLDGADIDEASLTGFDPSAVGPRVYARVESTGDVTEADTKGIADAAVTTAGGGTIYCFDTGFDVHTVTGTVESTAPTDRFLIAYNQGGPPCAAGDDAIAMVIDASAGTATAGVPFYIEIN